MSGGLPAAAELDRVVAGLTAELTARWSTVLVDDRWADVAASLRRLAAPGAVATLAQELGDAESRRIATLLLERWSAIGTPVLPPTAAVVRSSGAAGPELAVVVDGLQPGWTATWSGSVEPVDPSGAAVRLRVDGDLPGHVSVRVFGRTDDGRTILTAGTDLPADPPGAPGAAG